MLQHPTKVGQLVKFIPEHNNVSCPDNAIFKVIHYYEGLVETFVRVTSIPNLSQGYCIDEYTSRYATRFQVIPSRISYTKDIHGTIHNRPTPRPISSDERDRASEPLSSRGVNMDSFSDGSVSCESTPRRELSINPISPTPRLRETTSEDSRPSIGQDLLQWTRGLIDNVSNRCTEIPRPHYATEARRLEGNQSARYQRNAAVRHSVSTGIQESRPARPSILWGEPSTLGLPRTSLYDAILDIDAYCNYFSRSTSQR